MTDCCGCNVEIEKLAMNQKRVLFQVMIINFVTFFGMVVASWMSNSSALLSGTLDNLGDALTYALSLAVVAASTYAKARVALFKGFLICIAALAVAAHISWRLLNPETPLVTAMSVAAILNLLANSFCLWLLAAHKDDDVNMSSVYECSRNDVLEGIAVIVAAALVWALDSPWPDLLVAIILLIMFSRSAARVLSSAFEELRNSHEADRRLGSEVDSY